MNDSSHGPERATDRFVKPDRQPLNAVDQAMGVVDHSLRRLGAPGFETQTLVWLSSELDVPRLRAVLTLLIQHYPSLNGRLEWTPQEQCVPYWQHDSDEVLALHEIMLDADDPQTVLRHAAHLLSSSPAPSVAAPMRFYLLRRPGGKDVFLMQFNHTLLDYRASQFILREIDRLHATPSVPSGAVRKNWRDPVWVYLRRRERKRRLVAARDTITAWEQLLRRGALQLDPAATRQGSLQLGIATRRLDQETTKAVHASLVRACGFPSWSMAILASAFRALENMAPDQKSTTLVAGIGVDLGMPESSRPSTANWTSMIPIGVQRGDMHDRDDLRRLLSRQLRDRLAAGADLGLLELTMVFSRRRRQALWVIENFMRYCFSLWYAYFGVLNPMDSGFCGVPVEDVYSVGPCWAPMGLTLLVSQFRGCLQLQSTFVPEAVSEETANRFLDGAVEDLQN